MNRRSGGWFRESYRHYLAAKGVKTRRYHAGATSFQERIYSGVVAGQKRGDKLRAEARYGLGGYSGEELARLEALRQQSGSSRFIGAVTPGKFGLTGDWKFNVERVGTEPDAEGVVTPIMRSGVNIDDDFNLRRMSSGEEGFKFDIGVKKPYYERSAAELAGGKAYDEAQRAELEKKYSKTGRYDPKWRILVQQFPDLPAEVRDKEVGKLDAQIKKAEEAIKGWKNLQREGKVKGVDFDALNERLIKARNDRDNVVNSYDSIISMVNNAMAGVNLDMRDAKVLDEFYDDARKKGYIVEDRS